MGNICWTHPPFFRGIWSHKTSETLFLFVNFSILDLVQQSQCSRHFSKKSIPGLLYLKPHRKVNATTLELFATNLKKTPKNRPTRFQTLTFCRNLGFQCRDLSPYGPRGVYISRNDPPKKDFSIILANHRKTQFVDKMSSFFSSFFWAPVGRAL